MTTERIDVLAVMDHCASRTATLEQGRQLSEARAAVAELIEACSAYDKARENLLLSKRGIGPTYQKAAQLRDAVDRANLRRVTALARVGGA